MKLLFVLLAVVAVAMADPEEQLRARRGLGWGAPLLAPSAAIVTPALGGAVLAGHGPALIAPGAVVAGAPWGKAVVAGPAIWG